MTITNGYGDLQGYKNRYMDGDLTDRDDDPAIEAAIESVSRLIDNICGRRFYTADETRYFTPEHHDYLNIYDLVTISTLKTDENADRTYEVTWSTGDYDLMPYNAQADTYDMTPYTWLETAPLGDNYFPLSRKSVEIVGTWGFATNVPPAVKEACYLGAHRTMKRHQTALGVSASPSLGQLQVQVRQLRSDPDFMALVLPYVRATYG